MSTLKPPDHISAFTSEPSRRAFARCHRAPTAEAPVDMLLARRAPTTRMPRFKAGGSGGGSGRDRAPQQLPGTPFQRALPSEPRARAGSLRRCRKGEVRTTRSFAPVHYRKLPEAVTAAPAHLFHGPPRASGSTYITTDFGSLTEAVRGLVILVVRRHLIPQRITSWRDRNGSHISDRARPPESERQRAATKVAASTNVCPIVGDTPSPHLR